MPNAEIGSKGGAQQRVSVSNTAANMLSSLSSGNSSKVAATIENITADIGDPNKVKKLQGFDNIFVARGHGVKVVYKDDDDVLTIISVAVDS
jgi:mRNA-degrading endonuclease RelE of RelBE toxin-antitoxin system